MTITRFAAVVAVCPVLLLPPVTLATAGDDDVWKKNLERSLETLYQKSRMTLFDHNSVSQPGGTFVVQTDGIRAEAAVQSGVVLTRVRDGRILGQSVSGNIVNSVMSGRIREEARILKKGDRLYVTDVKVYDRAMSEVTFDLLTVETTPIIDQGRTRQMRYKARLVMEIPKSNLMSMSASDVKRLIDPFVLAEGEATAVQTKTVEMGQSPEQVETILGKPEKVIKLGEKTIFVYKDMKIVFVEGKVTDVQ
jgi:hypothetical protein